MKKLVFFIFCTLFFISFVSAVGLGYSCGYYPDSSPFCDEGLSCDYFQCVDAGDDPTCSEVGGDVCANTQDCDGDWISGTVENWCCSGRCEENFAKEGDFCAVDSDCKDKFLVLNMECVNFRCQRPSSDACRTFSQFCDSTYLCCEGLDCINGRCSTDDRVLDLYKGDCKDLGLHWCSSGDCVKSESDCPSDVEHNCWINNPFYRTKIAPKSPPCILGNLVDEWNLIDTFKWIMIVIGGIIALALLIKILRLFR